MDCPFCKAIEQEPERIVAQTELSFVLLSNPRLLKGHSLVVPKRHLEYPGELADDELVDIFRIIEKLRAKLLALYLATGVDIRQNYRPFLPQSRLKIDHVHFHVLPHANEDELYQKSMKYEKGVFKDLTEEERQEVLSLLNS